jgi:hypothetical protein
LFKPLSLNFRSLLYLDEDIEYRFPEFNKRHVVAHMLFLEEVGFKLGLRDLFVARVIHLLHLAEVLDLILGGDSTTHKLHVLFVQLFKALLRLG